MKATTIEPHSLWVFSLLFIFVLVIYIYNIYKYSAVVKTDYHLSFISLCIQGFPIFIQFVNNFWMPFWESRWI